MSSGPHYKSLFGAPSWLHPVTISHTFHVILVRILDDLGILILKYFLTSVYLQNVMVCGFVVFIDFNWKAVLGFVLFKAI